MSADRPSTSCTARAVPAWLGVALLLGAGGVGAASSADLVRDFGLRPFPASTRATDFRLPALGGGELALSDFAGEWVVLTFWASWCGPCRSEMPSLEALHRRLGDQGVAVLGVSLDSEIEAARGFAEEMGLGFPLLWDETGRVGADYRATAIPITYLIDPVGGLVGVATGARDWTQALPLFESLAGAESGAAEASYGEAGAVAIPQVLDPPQAVVSVSSNAPRAGQEFELEIRLRWAGTLEQYRPQTPKVHLPEGVMQTGVRASSGSADGSQVVVYRASLRAETAGSYALDPVELRYVPHLSSGPVTTRVAGPTVVVREPEIVGLDRTALTWAAGGLLGATVIGLAAGWRWRRNRRSAEPRETTELAELESDLQAARELRMRGEARASILALIDLARRLDSDGGLGERELDALEESVRYGGVVPTDDLRDRLQRSLEREIEARRPDPDNKTRAALRLRGDGV